MNSFNHYSYGSVVEWMFRNAAGLQPVEERPGFRRAMLAPQPDSKLRWMKASLNSPVGLYKSEWSIGDDGMLTFHFQVPFNASAAVVLPDAPLDGITVNGTDLAGSGLTAHQEGTQTVTDLTSGNWTFQYLPTRPYLRTFSTHTPLGELLAHPQARELIIGAYPQIAQLNPGLLRRIGEASPRELADNPMAHFDRAPLDGLDEQLKQIKA
jgi:alpha-L-rhamnosidase